MADAFPARFMDLAERSSDWRLNCSTHGAVQMVIVFNDDIKNRAYCQKCFEEEVVKMSRKVTFNANGAPVPEEAKVR